MSIDDTLAAAAASIGLMPDTAVTQRLEQLEAAHRRRSSLASARHQAEVDSLDLDWAAYQLGCQHDDAGDLAAAARYYRMAAANDFADAAFRLGTALEMLADQRAGRPEPVYCTSQREELTFVSDAARWYAEAYAAGHPGAAERLDGMISRHDPGQPPAAGPAPAANRGTGDCEQGGLEAVVNGRDLTTAATHFGHCTACQREFIRLGGLLLTPGTRNVQSQATSPCSPDAANSGALAGELAR
jgi:TPR repeat protein